MQSDQKFLVLAFYHFTPIENPIQEVEEHKTFFSGKAITSRIYISEDGINGQMSASKDAAHTYMEWLLSKEAFQQIRFKVHSWHEQVFPRQAVKYRKNLVGLDRKVDLSCRGDPVSPKKWKEMMESDQDYLMIDVRNDYETRIGHFKGAELPQCENFREFETYAESLRQEKDPKKTPVMMYCTGGIRCELYSSILKEKGFDRVYQLDGGIINYGLKEGSKHWLGKLFVFDDRLTVAISDEQAPCVGACHHCGQPSESYYNCANMDCNELFLCCPSCLKDFSGCCEQGCKTAPRVRPFHQQNPHKPFRRKHHY